MKTLFRFPSGVFAFLLTVLAVLFRFSIVLQVTLIVFLSSCAHSILLGVPSRYHLCSRERRISMKYLAGIDPRDFKQAALCSCGLRDTSRSICYFFISRFLFVFFEMCSRVDGHFLWRTGLLLGQVN